MREVVIAGYLRTAQSRSRPNDPARDWFCKMRSDELLDLVEELGLNERQKIGTLLNEVEASEVDDADEDENDDEDDNEEDED